MTRLVYNPSEQLNTFMPTCVPRSCRALLCQYVYHQQLWRSSFILRTPIEFNLEIFARFLNFKMWVTNSTSLPTTIYPPSANLKKMFIHQNENGEKIQRKELKSSKEAQPQNPTTSSDSPSPSATNSTITLGPSLLENHNPIHKP